MRTVNRILAVLLSLCLSGIAEAAVGSNTVWWIQTTAPAGNTSGGGFDTGAAFDNTLSCTSATGSAPVCTSSNYTFLVGDQGYWLYVQSGSNWTPGWYQINTVSGGAATLFGGIGTALQVDLTKGSPYGHYQLNTVAGCATTASPTAGVWGIDYARNDTRIINAVADLTIDGTVNTKVTSASRSCGVNDIGNMIHVLSGTSWTAGYYEVGSCTGAAFNLDRSPSAAANANKGTWYYGGASSLGSSTTGRTDANLFSAGAAGNRVLIKSGTYTLSVAATTAGGTAALPYVVEGYNTTPGDGPTGSSRPTIACGAVAFTVGTVGEVYNVMFTGTTTTMVVAGTSDKFINLKSVNSSTTAGRTALSCTATSAACIFNEAVSYRGAAMTRGTGGGLVYGNYLHDSDKGISSSGGSIAEMIVGNIFADNVTAAYVASIGVSQFYAFVGNTFYGAENKLGIALSLPTAMVNPRLFNNIFYGFATGIGSVDTQEAGYSDYNDYFNNTADFSSALTWQYGMHDLALNPTFTSMGQYTGTNASVSGSVLTDSGANFANTTDNVDFLYISNGGAGPSVVGKYMITSHTSTTLTVDIAPTNSASGVVYQTTYGHNFAIGTNLKAQGLPNAFPGGLTTGYLDIGAAQRQEAASGGGTKGWTWAQ